MVFLRKLRGFSEEAKALQMRVRVGGAKEKTKNLKKGIDKCLEF